MLQNNKVCPPSFSPPFCPSFFGLRPSFLQPYGDLLAQSMIPGFPGISITRPCKLSDAAIRRRAAGDETPLEILTIAAGRSVSRGAHGLSLARGIRLIALTQLSCRGDEREEGLSGFMTTMRRRRVSDGSRRCRIISRRRRDIIRKLEA